MACKMLSWCALLGFVGGKMGLVLVFLPGEAVWVRGLVVLFQVCWTRAGCSGVMTLSFSSVAGVTSSCVLSS